MSLSHLPPELLGPILANIFPDKWNHYNSGLKVLNLELFVVSIQSASFESFH
jgi:hypothetical protein